MTSRLDEIHRRSLADPEGFWGEAAGQIDWYRKWDRVLDWSYSNLSLLFKAGYRAGKEFYKEKTWLHGHKPADVRAAP